MKNGLKKLKNYHDKATKMNRKEAHKVAQNIAKYVNNQFKDIYPDAFLHCTTKDPEIYKSANPCIYSWYLRALNGILDLDFSPKYQQTYDETIESDWSCVETFFVDMKHTNNFLKFLIENVKIGY